MKIMLIITKRLASIIAISYTSSILSSCAQSSNFTVKSEPVKEVVSKVNYNKSRSAMYYRLPTSEFTISAKFQVWAIEEVSYNIHSKKEIVKIVKYEIIPDQSVTGLTATAKKIGHKKQLFLIDLNRSDSPYTAVNELVIDLADEGFIKSIQSELADKRAETIKNVVKIIGEGVALASGVPIGILKRGGFEVAPLDSDSNKRYVRRTDLDFTVSKGFTLDDVNISKDEKGSSYYIDLTDQVKILYPRLRAHEKPADVLIPTVRLYLEGKKNTFNRYDAVVVTNEIMGRTPNPTEERPYVTGIIYPLPTYIVGKIAMKTVKGEEFYNKINLTSIQGGGVIDCKSQPKRLQQKNTATLLVQMLGYPQRSNILRLRHRKELLEELPTQLVS